MSKKRFLRSLERPALNLAVHKFWDVINGLHVIGTWHCEGPRRWHPCMVLLDAAKPISSKHQIPFVIPLRDSWRWAYHGDVGDPAHCAAAMHELVASGILPGSTTEKATYMRIIDAVNRRLPDLIAMPPRPPKAGGDSIDIGEVTAIDKTTGKILIQQEVKLDV